MQVIRGTRAPFLAAACAMLIIGAGSADAAQPQWVYATAYFVSPTLGGPDGCPVSPVSFDPRELCSADLGAGFVPLDAEFVQVCPPGPNVVGVALVSSTVSVIERITPEPDAASAIAAARARLTCALNTKSKLFGPSRELPAVAIPGAATEGQLVTDLRGGGAEVRTIVAIGPDMLTVGVVGDEGMPDEATVLRVVNAAVQRFHKPRPSGGPFPSVTTTTFVNPSAPSS